jgi:zinc protease
MKLFVRVLCLIALPLAWCASVAFALDVKEVRTAGGLSAWLVEDKTVPLIAMNFAFSGGTARDPAGKEGVVNFITGMMDEGAGTMTGPQFQSLRDNLAIRLRFDAGNEQFYGKLETLSRNRKQAFDLLKQAVTAPHFEPEAVDRMRKHFVLSAQNKEKDPESIAYQEWVSLAVGTHPYSRRGEGTPESLQAITREDLLSAHKEIFTRSDLKITVVGDVTAEELAVLLDETFGALPAGSTSAKLPVAQVSAMPVTKVIPFDIPQSIIIFGQAGILQDDPEYFSAYVMSHILGGYSNRAWLTEEVREKRGLTYGVGYSLSPMPSAGLYVGSLNTVNEKAGEAMAAIRATLQRMAELGPTQKELDDAKSYLTGSYALRFDTNEKIAGYLMVLQLAGESIDFPNRRNAVIEAVTLEQVKAQAKRLLKPDQLIVVAVGKPVDLK